VVTFPAASQADHLIALNRPPDGNRRGLLDGGFSGLFAELPQRVMHAQNELGKQIGHNLISPHISRDNLGCALEIDRSGPLLVRHRLSSPLSASQYAAEVNLKLGNSSLPSKQTN
jgi:hypothetical protein